MLKSLLPQRPPFPPLSPESEAPHVRAFDQWAKRILTLVGLLGVLGTTCSYLGWQNFGPGPRTAAVEAATRLNSARIDTVRDDLAVIRAEAADTKRDVGTSIYIGCQLLAIQQPNAIPLQECVDARNRRNGR